MLLALQAAGLVVPGRTAVVLSDMNPWLINAYRVVRDNPKELSSGLCDAASEYDDATVLVRKDQYLDTRARRAKVPLDQGALWARDLTMIEQDELLEDDEAWPSDVPLADRSEDSFFPDPWSDHAVEAAVDFFFLNRAGFNGLWRENKKGEMNVPWGKVKQLRFPADSAIHLVSQAIQGARILHGDFADALAGALGDPRQLHLPGVSIQRNALLFLDPPYAGGFVAYTAAGFGDADQRRVAKLAQRWATAGGDVLITNSADVGDLYRETGLQVEPVEERRAINSDADKRGGVPCVLAYNAPEGATETLNKPSMQTPSGPPGASMSTSTPTSIPASEANPGTEYWGRSGNHVRVVGPDANKPGQVIVENIKHQSTVGVPGTYLLYLAPPEGTAIAPVDAPDADPAAPKPKAKPAEPAKAKAPKPKKQLFHHVASITGTVKTLQGTIELGPKTLLLGSNGSGKTAIQHMLTLALDGSAYDMLGRDQVRKGADVVSLLPPDAGDELYIEAALSDDRRATYHLRNKGTSGGKISTSKPSHTVPPGLKVVFPLQEVFSNLRGSPDKAQRWLAQAAGTEGGDSDAILGLIPEDLQKLYATLAPTGATGNAQLLGVSELLPSEARVAKADHKAAQKALDASQATLAPEPTDEQLTAVTERIARWESRLAEAKARVATEADSPEAASAAGAIAALQAEIAEKQAKITAYRAAIEKVQGDDLAAAQAQHAKARAALDEASGDPEKGAAAQSALALLKFTLDRDRDTCAACNQPAGREHIQARHDALDQGLAAKDQSLSALRDAVEKANAAVAQQHARITNGQSAIADLDAAITRTKSAIQLMEAQAAERAAAAVATLTDTEGSETAPVSVEVAATELANAQNELRQKERDKGAHKVLKNQINAVSAAAVRVATLERLQSTVSTLVGQIVQDATSTFTARVQASLPAEMRFWLDPTTGHYGLLALDSDGNVTHRRRALGGWESVCVDSALAMAVTPADADVVLLCPDDRSVTPKALRSAMAAWSKFAGQVVVASTTKPHGKTPKGWTVVNLDERAKA